jgi:hypothetical protein
MGACGRTVKHIRIGNGGGFLGFFGLKSAGNLGFLVEGVGFEPT